MISKGSPRNYRITFIRIDTNSIVCVTGAISFNSYSCTREELYISCLISIRIMIRI